MIVLGIDPGLAALGYGVVAVERSRPVARVWGVLRTARRRGLSRTGDLTVRVDELARAIAAVLDAHRPDEAALEAFEYHGRAVTSGLQLGNAVGMLREALRARGVPTAEYGAQAIKRAVAGDGRADKRAVQAAVRLHLGLAAAPRPAHAADALAAALTHAARLPLRRASGGRL